MPASSRPVLAMLGVLACHRPGGLGAPLASTADACPPSDTWRVGVLVPSVNDELGPNRSSSDEALHVAMGTDYLPVYFAGEGADVPWGSPIRATWGTVDAAATRGLPPYALVRYALDCGLDTGGMVFGATLTRWERIDGGREVPMDVPAVLAAVRSRAAWEAAPLLDAALPPGFSVWNTVGEVQPPRVLEWYAWEDGVLVATLRVRHEILVRGWCPGAPSDRMDCNLPMGRALAERTTTVRIGSTGEILEVAVGPVSASQESYPPPPGAPPAGTP